jgi:hypothetical protein
VARLDGNYSISDDASTRHFKPVKRGKIMHEKHYRIDDVSENSEGYDFRTPLFTSL